MKKHIKKWLSVFMAVLLCFGILPSSAFAEEYADGYISMIDHSGRGYSLSSSLPSPFGGISSEGFLEMRINDLRAFRTAYCIEFGVETYAAQEYEVSDDYAAFTKEQIYESVWEEPANGCCHAVENTVFQIRKKLRPFSGEYGFIRTLTGYGYRYDPCR